MLDRQLILWTVFLLIYSTSRTLANMNDSSNNDHNFRSQNHTNVTIPETNNRNRTNVDLRVTNANASNASFISNTTNANSDVNPNATTNANASNASFTSNSTNANFDVNVTDVSVNETTNVPTAEESANIFKKIHRTVTRSKDAVWATVTLTFVCVLLLVSVAQSKMWKDHHFRESQGVPLPDFNERVLFKDVMEHKLKSLRSFFKKKKKKENATEMKSLLLSDELEEEDDRV